MGTAYGFEPTQSWVSLLVKRLHDQQQPYTVVNISSIGDTSQEGLEKLPAALARYHPRVVIVALGANDGLRGFPTAFIYKNLSQIIECIRGQDARMLLVRLELPSNYGLVYQKQFADVFEQLDQHYHLADTLIRVDTLRHSLENKQADRLHPTIQAQQAILEILWKPMMQVLKD